MAARLAGAKPRASPRSSETTALILSSFRSSASAAREGASRPVPIFVKTVQEARSECVLQSSARRSASKRPPASSTTVHPPSEWPIAAIRFVAMPPARSEFARQRIDDAAEVTRPLPEPFRFRWRFIKVGGAGMIGSRHDIAVASKVAGEPALVPPAAAISVRHDDQRMKAALWFGVLGNREAEKGGIVADKRLRPAIVGGIPEANVQRSSAFAAWQRDFAKADGIRRLGSGAGQAGKHENGNRVFVHRDLRSG